MRIPRNHVVRSLKVATSMFSLFAVLSLSTFGQKDLLSGKSLPTFDGVPVTKMAPTPVFFSGAGNITCSDLIGHPSFPQVVTAEEVKFDSGEMSPGTKIKQVPSNPALSITVTIQNSTTVSSWSLGWTSASSLNRLVSAVILKSGAAGKNVYSYPFLSAGDTGPFVTPNGNGNGLSHISFCLEPFTAPSAASSTVGGRVATSKGLPISGATIMVQNLSTGDVKYVTTNTYGRYAVSNLPVGDFYVVSIAHRRYIFDDATRYFTLDADLTDTDFTSR